MAKVMLNGSGIVAVVGELVAAGMAQHVAVNEKGEPGSLPGPGNHALISGRAEGSTALGHEHIRSRRSSSPAAAAAGPGFPWRLWDGGDYPNFGPLI